MQAYPKRLIEVDLPIKRISAHARREKSIRHGHISTLHIWWARRPLAACRAVICAALWPDPADVLCPDSFRQVARQWMNLWSKENIGKLSQDSYSRFVTIQKKPERLNDNEELRGALLDFIADFANWDNSTVKEYLDTSRALTQAAHEALGGAPGTRPLVVDPFAGGGSIPLEALRVGADAFASDLNPIPVLLNKVILEYIPKYGQRLADEVSKWGEWIKREAEKELAEFYPKGADGATPIAYLWTRTIQCEGPGCGADVPLIRSLWLAKKANHFVALRLVPNPKAKRVDFQIISKQRDGWVDQDDHNEKITDPKFDGTVKRGSATCPCCGYTTPVKSVRKQLLSRKGGAYDARLFCVVKLSVNAVGRIYHLPQPRDTDAVRKASAELEKRIKAHSNPLSLLPEEQLPLMSGVFNAPIYGHDTWSSLFTPRQALALTTLVKLIKVATTKLEEEIGDEVLATAIQTCLALNFDRVADLANNLCGWTTDTQCVKHLFARQAIPMVWNFAESVVISDSAGSWGVVTERFPNVVSAIGWNWLPGSVQQASATNHPLPDDAANAFVTDPPYYNAVPYADLSDFFYVWLRRILNQRHGELFSASSSPKNEEVCERGTVRIPS